MPQENDDGFNTVYLINDLKAELGNYIKLKLAESGETETFDRIN